MNTPLHNISRNSLLKRILTVLAATVVIVWFYPHSSTNKFHYEEGRPWNYSQLIAPFDIPIHPDSLTIRQLRDTLDARFIPIYTLSNDITDSIVNELPDGAGKAQLISILRKAYSGGVVSKETSAKIDSGILPRIRVLEQNIMSEMSTGELMSPRGVYEYLEQSITNLATRQYFLNSNINSLLRPNLIYDQAENKRVYDNEYQTVTADRGVILQGQAIINKGDIISAQDYTNLRTYEQLLEERSTNDTKSSFVGWLGRFVYMALLLGLLCGIIAWLHPRVFMNIKAFSFIYIIITVFYLISVVLSWFIPGGVYIVPLTIVTILLTTFVNTGIALVVSVITTMVCAPAASFSAEFIFLQLCAALISTQTLGELSRRSQLLRTAISVAATYIVAYASLELLLNGTFEDLSLRMVAFLIANAVLTSMAYILMSAVERPFGFISTVTLSELADINQPLLRKLSDYCPGTFQHSMGVSNLAADAARAIGADEALVRAGALYHDIGKMANPAFFTENQHGVNPHDVLPPEQSARIVIEHVTEGLRLADKSGLPSVIKDFIVQHHGAGKAKYFYYMYCKAHPDEENPNAESFTYPGPNPATRETSLLMMADAVEAASRSLADYTKQSISDLVNKIVDSQIAEGLHGESTLEFRDVPIIKNAFIKRLMTMYHTRIAYPDDAKPSQDKQ